MYATSSTNGTSLLIEAYFVAMFQNVGSSEGFLDIVWEFNNYDSELSG
jgi:hypothetical protein